MSSPWGAVPAPAAVPMSFQDVMSEELAGQLQQEEYTGAEDAGAGASSSAVVQDQLPPVSVKSDIESFRHPQDTSDDFLLAQRLQQAEEQVGGVSETTTTEMTDDLLLAQMMQAEFDKEHDYVISKEEQQFNKQSKVSISFEKYRRTHPVEQEEDDGMSSEEEEYWDEGQYVKKPGPNFKNGISGKGKNIVTKHDAGICDRKNATKVMEQFPPGLNIGDSAGIDMKLSNKVYNNLKKFSIADNKRANKLHEKKEHSTAVMAMDERTRILVYKMVNSEILEGVSGIVSSGKEAVVLHAVGGSAVVNASPVPEEVAIKVFKTTLTDFKNRSIYVKGDVRYFKDEFKKQNPRKIMKIWASKEEYNLKRLAKHIPVPKVVVLRKHVLVMEFIGKNQKAAPKLKDAHMKLVDYELAFDQVKDIMKKMYHDCVLVHADLSEYNLLWFNDMVYVIDVGQAVDLMHPRAHEFLLRDCRNISQFFTKAGVAEVGTEYSLFNEVTGLNLTGDGPEFLAQIQEYEKNEEKIRTGKGKDFAFDHFFDLSKRDHQDSDDTDSEDEEGEEH